jgi:multisubunit Na+/H+ antiporter MnhB subunit
VIVELDYTSIVLLVAIVTGIILLYLSNVLDTNETDHISKNSPDKTIKFNLLNFILKFFHQFVTMSFYDRKIAPIYDAIEKGKVLN